MNNTYSHRYVRACMHTAFRSTDRIHSYREMCMSDFDIFHSISSYFGYLRFKIKVASHLLLLRDNKSARPRKRCSISSSKRSSLTTSHSWSHPPSASPFLSICIAKLLNLFFAMAKALGPPGCTHSISHTTPLGLSAVLLPHRIMNGTGSSPQRP